MSKGSFPGLFFLLLAALLLSGTPLQCQQPDKPKKEKRKKPFRDPVDSAFDITYYLYNLHGFLPIVSPITEPAVGYGAMVAGAFFIPKKDKGDKGFQMPDMVGLGGGYTQNNTWFVGAGYFGFWKQDRIRYRGAGGYGDIKLKYYGEGDGFLSEHPIEFTISTYMLLQQATFRLGDSRFMLGGKYLFASNTVTLFANSDLDWINPRDLKFTVSGAGLIAEYENFDYILSPTSGWRIHASYNQYLEMLGSDGNFGTGRLFVLWYQPLTSFWSSGLRLAGSYVTGDPPFYMLPFLELRGIPAMRYQGEATMLAETEQHFLLTRRWSVLGFGGYGQTFYYNNDEMTGSVAWNAGAGFRYLIARPMGLRMGIDVARGPENWAFYIVFGSAWLR